MLRHSHEFRLEKDKPIERYLPIFTNLIPGTNELIDRIKLSNSSYFRPKRNKHNA